MAYPEGANENVILSQMVPAECRNVPPRWLWAVNRFRMETENRRTRKYGRYGRQHWYVLKAMVTTLRALLKVSFQYGRGVRNAYDIRLTEHELTFADLPDAFDGLSILHLSDLHLDAMPGLVERALTLWGGRNVDLCVLTGDYRRRAHGLHRQALGALRDLLAGISAREGVFGVLGNHDDCHMVRGLEALDIRMLINESFSLRRDGQSLRLLGVDDVHYYYTDQVVNLLEDAAGGDEFSILLVHSPELYEEAARLGVDLYLCGHTHGGQVCLPGGLGPIRHVYKGRRFYRGLWTYEGMQGFTTNGLGTSGLPVRFFCPGEMALLRLRRGAEHTASGSA